MHSQSPDELDRQQFLQRATLLMGAVVGATVAVPATVMAIAPAFHTGSYYDIDLGPTVNFPVDAHNPYRVVTFEAAPHGRLDAVDMQLRRHPLKPPGEPVGGTEAILYPAARQ
jgi:hypothetical protein